jgi:exonuclease SbcC
VHITKLELENIKSYEHAIFEFEPGTTAIMGENGAGKTTIIEAVAWTLFDLLDYKKDDFLRRGSKRGVVRIEFESGLDERRYVVQRDTRTAYFVYDTQLNTRIADKKEEVTRFLWQHLGVEPGTDLESLFRRAIGVPQGTFTAVFLETATERKKAFDKLLKVEEYRIGAMKLGMTSKFVQSELFEVEKQIARAEGELSNREVLQKELKEQTERSKDFNKEAKKAKKELAAHTSALKRLEKGKKKFESLNSSLDSSVQKQKTFELVKQQTDQQLAQARTASEMVRKTKADHEKHLAVLGMLKELERERVERDKLNRELADIEKAIVNVKAEQKTVISKLEEIARTNKTLKELRPKAARQKEFEESKQRIENEITKTRVKKTRLDELAKSLTSLRERLKQNNEEIKKLEPQKLLALELPKLQSREKELTNELASIHARLERDREFQTQIQNGLCPILSAKCLNLGEGQSLEGFLNDKFSDLKSTRANLEKDQRSASASLKKAREAESAVSGLSILNNRRDEIVVDGKRLRDEHDRLEGSTEKLAELEKELTDIIRSLEKLGNPAPEVAHLEKQLSEVHDLQLQSTKIESNLERLGNDRGIKIEQLDLYRNVDESFKSHSETRDSTIDAHNNFIKSERLATLLPEFETKMAAADADLSKIAVVIEKTRTSLLASEKNFDVASYEESRTAVSKTQIEHARVANDAKHAESRVKQIEAGLKKLETAEKKIIEDAKEKERLDKLLETVGFIRNTLKAAAPRVAKNYVFHVSVEANTLYREITGNAEATLRWTNDYGIELEQGGHSRPFISLSGGEQMSAALAVRLALLKQLSDVKLAFFDEPTTNMDMERRERLAEQISRITENRTFDQLFVISHDDTFETFADHVLSIGE